jgi:hypothetical protein
LAVQPIEFNKRIAAAATTVIDSFRIGSPQSRFASPCSILSIFAHPSTKEAALELVFSSDPARATIFRCLIDFERSVSMRVAQVSDVRSKMALRSVRDSASTE